MELSKRLQAVANLVSPGLRIADVGTDHGYIPIYFMQTGKCSKAIAMDVNAGPLQRACDHISAYGLPIETRLSDGVLALNEGDVDCVIVAGMGGALTIRIMEDGATIFKGLKEFVLQPQSEIQKVRAFLQENHYRIIAEDMVFEDGKFYPMMKVINEETDNYNRMELKFGKLLLEMAHPVLHTFLEKELGKRDRIISALQKECGAHIETRINVIREELEEIQDALQRYFGVH